MTSHTIIPTPFGVAALIYHDDPFLLIEVLLPPVNRKNLVDAVTRNREENTCSHPKALIVLRLLSEYFKGKPIQPPWQWMDVNGYTSLQKAVLAATADIPYGQVRSYREIAEAVGRSRAYRFVGTTLAKNRFPLLIPCHRVVKSDSSIGRFGGGTDLKRKLIEREKAASKGRETLERVY